MTADQELQDALIAVWRIPRPGPEQLFSAPAFVALSDLCKERYDTGDIRFGLSNALRSLGLPCRLPAKQAALALDISAAADALHSAFARRKTVHRHLCPLDLADDLPPLSFGTARVERFSADELAALFDAPRLARVFPTLPLESERLAQFHWLVVEEKIELDPRSDARALPFLFKVMPADFGEVDPHRGRFPLVVENALFFLLLARWEDWSTIPEANWCGFHVPWIYTIDEDLFVLPTRPPSADSLEMEQYLLINNWGEEIEDERPRTLPLDDCARIELQQFTNEAWTKVQSARATPLFETPIAHFLVHAFLADGIDEFMAHMTAIEAALGHRMDFKKTLRPPADNYSLGASKRVAARIGAILNNANPAKDYLDLFDLRSDFIHGRGGVQKISTQQRILARSLARRVTCALVELAATQPTRSREDILSELLSSGVHYLSRR